MDYKKRKEEIFKMREDRYTYKVIAKKFDITRQRVQQIVTGYKSPVIIKPPTELSIKRNKKFNVWCLENGIDYVGNVTNLTGMISGARERIRELVRIRDGHTCQACKKKWEEGKRRLDVHHLDNDKEKSLHCDKLEETDNMITLCHKCHLNLPAHRESMKKLV